MTTPNFTPDWTKTGDVFVSRDGTELSCKLDAVKSEVNYCLSRILAHYGSTEASEINHREVIALTERALKSICKE